jgi:hypothetical protein
MRAKESSFAAPFHIIHRPKPLNHPRNQSRNCQCPMKKISELFSDEDKKQLSYLGSNLSRPNTPFEEEVQRILDAEETSQG